MIDHVKLVLTEAIEAGAQEIAKDSGVDWDTANFMVQLRLREMAIIPVRAAAPFIVQQVLNDITSRTYNIE